jgi:hypothetical protein
MQQVSFLDINKTPTQQEIAPPCKNTPIPGLPEVPGAVDPKTTTCLTPPRNVLWCKSSDGSSKSQTCQDQGPLTLERSKGVDEEISAKVIDFLIATILAAPTSRFSSGTTGAYAHHHRAERQVLWSGARRWDWESTGPA